MSGWRQGDRVAVLLPDPSRPKGRGVESSWVIGTIREVDPPGLPAGVRVDLDYEVGGSGTCFATHSELRRVGVPVPGEAE